MRGLRIGVVTGLVTVLFAAAALAAPVSTSAPTLTGKPAYLSKLTCHPGTWSGAASLSYSWEAGGGAVPGPTGPTWAPGTDWIGYQIACVVTATDATGATASASSNAVNFTAATPTVRITKASVKRHVITLSGTIAPKQALSGQGELVLYRKLSHNQGLLQLTSGGVLVHHKSTFTVKVKDAAKGHLTYVLAFNPSARGFVAQVEVTKKLTVR